MITPRNPMVAGVDGTIPESELPLEDTADTGLPDGKKGRKAPAPADGSKTELNFEKSIASQQSLAISDFV